jgi:hypothetical protein
MVENSKSEEAPESPRVTDGFASLYAQQPYKVLTLVQSNLNYEKGRYGHVV